MDALEYSAILDETEGCPSDLIEVLQDIQTQCNYLPESALGPIVVLDGTYYEHMTLARVRKLMRLHDPKWRTPVLGADWVKVFSAQDGAHKREGRQL